MDKIGGIEERKSSEAGASSYAASLSATPSSSQVGQSAPPESTGIKEISDKADLSKTDKAEEAGGANLQGIRSALDTKSQGFEQGVQPSFALNSVQGVQSGLEPGLHPAGVHKSPPEA